MTHRAAIATIAAAVLDTAGGLGFAAVEHRTAGEGLYWALTTATTVGYGDVTPKTAGGHVIAALVMLTVVPLFAATFSLFTSGLTATHIKREGRRIRAHTEGVIGERRKDDQ